jgi:hypothetical protein
MATIGFGDQFVKQAIDFGKMADDLRNADDREISCVDHGVAPRSPHAIPTYPKEFQGWIALTQSLDKLSPIHFTRSFASGDENSHRSIVLGKRRGD